MRGRSPGPPDDAAGGASLLSVNLTHDELVTTKVVRKNESHELQYTAVLFDGTLQVHDPIRLQQTLQAGIGSGKGLGFGLLSLAPPAKAGVLLPEAIPVIHGRLLRREKRPPRNEPFLSE